MNDEQLLLLYYGEHDDPELAARVANDPELSRRFRQLSRQLEAIEQMSLPERGDDYGSEVWQKIEARLASPPRRESFWKALHQPRFSLAGAAAVMFIAAMAFTLGRHSASPQIDPRQLLASEVAAHLSQTDMLLTGLANGELDPTSDQWAQQLLLPNRLYRSAAASQADPRLANLLRELETLLLQLAHAPEEQVADPELRTYVEEQLLMKVRMMRASLNNKPNRA